MTNTEEKELQPSLLSLTKSRLDKKDITTCLAILNQKFSTCAECYNTCCSRCRECSEGSSISTQCQGDVSDWSQNPCCQCIYNCHDSFNSAYSSPKIDACPGGGGGLPDWNAIGCSNGIATGKITSIASAPSLTISSLGGLTSTIAVSTPEETGVLSTSNGSDGSSSSAKVGIEIGVASVFIFGGVATCAWFFHKKYKKSFKDPDDWLKRISLDKLDEIVRHFEEEGIENRQLVEKLRSYRPIKEKEREIARLMPNLLFSNNYDYRGVKKKIDKLLDIRKKEKNVSDDHNTLQEEQKMLVTKIARKMGITKDNVEEICRLKEQIDEERNKIERQNRRLSREEIKNVFDFSGAKIFGGNQNWGANISSGTFNAQIETIPQIIQN